MYRASKWVVPLRICQIQTEVQLLENSNIEIIKIKTEGKHEKKEEIKLSLFIDDMMVYKETLKNRQKDIKKKKATTNQKQKHNTLLKRKSDYSKVVRLIIDIQKFTFLYIPAVDNWNLKLKIHTICISSKKKKNA